MFPSKFYMYECFPWMYVCVPCACLMSESQKRMSDPLGLELQVVVSYHVDAGSWSQVLCKSNKCSLLLSHHSGPVSPVWPSLHLTPCACVRGSVYLHGYILCLLKHTHPCSPIHLGFTQPGRSSRCHHAFLYPHPSGKGNGHRCWANMTWRDKVGAWICFDSGGTHYSWKSDKLKAKHRTTWWTCFIWPYMGFV